MILDENITYMMSCSYNRGEGWSYQGIVVENGNKVIYITAQYPDYESAEAAVLRWYDRWREGMTGVEKAYLELVTAARQVLIWEILREAGWVEKKEKEND